MPPRKILSEILDAPFGQATSALTRRGSLGKAMTEHELDELLTEHATLYHMASRGAWQNIKAHGLLSTSALFHKYGVPDAVRRKWESSHRPNTIVLECEGMPPAEIRDQHPMSDTKLRKALVDDLSPAEWYALLNRKVFFWLTPDRLRGMAASPPYKHKEHDVLELDARSLVAAHRQQIWLSPINSGSTLFNPAPRGKATFALIDQYPYTEWKAKRRGRHPVVELAVDWSVPDIKMHIRRAYRLRGDTETEVLA